MERRILRLGLRLCSLESTRRCYVPAVHVPKVVENLKNRQLITGSFPVDLLDKNLSLLQGVPPRIYAGFDPTAPSLHLGHLLVICAMLHFRAAGFDVVFVIGGGTARLGDPTGRSEDRPVLSDAELRRNVCSVSGQISSVCDHFDRYIVHRQEDDRRALKPVTIEDNETWFRQVDVLRFFDCVGRAFRLRHMMNKKCVTDRMGHAGMSYGEFSYQVLQAYDWLHLVQTRSCLLQLGGSDQLGNIHSGRDLIKAVCDREAYGLLLPLLESDSGQKMGKSSGNVSIWLDPERSSPYSFYQHFVRIPDSDVGHYLKLFSFFSSQEIDQIVEEHSQRPELRFAQLSLARQLTLLVHGASGLDAALKTTSVLFAKPRNFLFEMDNVERQQILSQLPSARLSSQPSPTVQGLALSAGCFDSVEEAESAIKNGGFLVNNFRIKDPIAIVPQEVLRVERGFSLLKVGKRTHYVVFWK